MAWIGRTPLMPVLAGIGAVGVVTAAFMTQQISLNFAPPAKKGTESAACAGCDALEGTTPRTEVQAAVPGGTEEPADDQRTATKPALRATFRLSATTGSGFTAIATLRNTTDKPLTAWKLKFRIPNATVVGAQGATVQTLKANGGTTLLAGTAVLDAGGTLKIQFTGQGAWSKPAGCRLNGEKCSV